MRLRPTLLIALGLALAAPRPAPAQVSAMARDQMFEIANEHLLLRWNCVASNIYSGVTNATCPYSTTGWKDGIAYKWGGYDTRDSYWTNVVVNGGWAGDTNSAAVVSGTYGDDCSGYLSRIWRSGRYTTSSFPGISPEVGYTVIAPGDIMNYAGSHVRMFERYTATNVTMEYECTTGVSPGRVVRRAIATDSRYLARRYNKVVAWPSIVRATASGPSSALIEFLGHASTGFRVYRSTDQTNWTAVVTESTLGVQAQSATVTGLVDGTTYFFRVVALNGAVESAPSAIFPLRIAAGARKALLVNGYDRWIRKTESGALPPNFLTRLSDALLPHGYAFDSVDNLRVQDGGVALAGYSSVWWLLGDESTEDETFAYQEQLRLQTYLDQGGRLFVSGAEIFWDLINKAGPINDLNFATNYLKAGYTSDGTSGNGYGFSGLAGTVFAGQTGAFDSGSGGMFNVLYPDVISPQGGAQALMTYTGGGTAGIAYRGTFGTGTMPGGVVVLGFPFESITSTAQRTALAGAVTNALYSTAGVSDSLAY